MKYIIQIIVIFLVCVTASSGAEASQHASVIGSANAPGAYEVAPNDSVWNLMQKAKGANRLWMRRISITREIDGEKKTIQYDSRKREDKEMTEQQYWESIKVYPGDIIFLQEIVC